MTDPNFLHAGDHVHLGPGVTGERVTNPAIDLHKLPRIDAVLLSHYHADHFNQKVEASLRCSLLIITTPYAKSCLQSKGPEESFTKVHDLNFFQSMILDINDGTTTAGKHVPPGPLSVANDLSKAVRAATLEITLDAKQGIELVQLIQPDVTIPIHYE
jgi:L-ascorbate metabolism protein UlaG (beta-lactamase superfamily)